MGMLWYLVGLTYIFQLRVFSCAHWPFASSLEMCTQISWLFLNGLLCPFLGWRSSLCVLSLLRCVICRHFLQFPGHPLTSDGIYLFASTAVLNFGEVQFINLTKLFIFLPNNVFGQLKKKKNNTKLLSAALSM